MFWVHFDSYYKSEYLEKNDIKTILEYHSLFEYLYNMLNWGKHIEFSEVRNTILDYSNQKQIDTQREKSF